MVMVAIEELSYSSGNRKTYSLTRLSRALSKDRPEKTVNALATHSCYSLSAIKLDIAITSH